MQQLQLGIFVAAMIAIVVGGCIFTRKPKKGPLNTVSNRPSARPRAIEARRIAANIVKLPEFQRSEPWPSTRREGELTGIPRLPRRNWNFSTGGALT
jgi:hypothetical protein